MVAGRYRLLRPLGRGGMGTVWHAHDTLLGRDVAIKEIWLPTAGVEPVGPADPLIRRALREAQAAARLRHPGIITVHDVLTDEGRPWIVMELVNGRSLAQAIEEHGLLTERQTAQIGLHVVDALQAAHREGITHRDIKPANILLDIDRVVLTDFGIAAIDDATALTATGQMVGSPAYLAPERINGRPATAAADLWALGVTLYTAVTGRSPFQRDNTQTTFAAILTSRPTPPAHAGRLWPVIKGLLTKDPARRLTGEQARGLLANVAHPTDPATPARGTRRPDWWPARGAPRRSAPDGTAGTLAAPPPTVAAPTAYQTPQGDRVPGAAPPQLAKPTDSPAAQPPSRTEPAVTTAQPPAAPPSRTEPAATAVQAEAPQPQGRTESAMAADRLSTGDRPVPAAWRRWVLVAAVTGFILVVMLTAIGALVAADWIARWAQAPTPTAPQASASTASHPPSYAYSTTLLAGRPICAAVWNPAGTRYAVTSADTGLEIFGRDGVLVRKFAVALADDRKCYLNDPGVYWDPSGTTVAVIGGSVIGKHLLYFFNAETGTTVVARLAVGQVSEAPMWESTGAAVAVRTKSYGVVLVAKDGTVGRELLPRSALSSASAHASLTDTPWCISISPRGDTVAVGWLTKDGDGGPLFEVRRFADATLVREVGRKSQGGDAGILAYDPTGALLAVGFHRVGAEVEVWDPLTQRRVATLRGPSGEISDLRWSGNGKYLLVASHGDQQIHVFRASDWVLLGTLAPHRQTGAGVPLAGGGVGDDGSVLLAPWGSRGIDVYKLT